MLRHNQISAFVLLAGTLACSSTSPAPTVPVAGSDVSALTGRWAGDYASEGTGRTGSVVFELKAGETVARGDVLMVPKGANDPQQTTAAAVRTMPQVLTINFVNASGGVLRGTMDPYRDPACDCEVQTTFVGRLSGDTIEGTFTTTPSAGGAIATGRWKMSRQKK